MTAGAHRFDAQSRKRIRFRDGVADLGPEASTGREGTPLVFTMVAPPPSSGTRAFSHPTRRSRHRPLIDEKLALGAAGAPHARPATTFPLA